MNYSAENIDSLIVKCLAGDATQEETVQLIDWRTLSPENEKYFADMQFIFEKSSEVIPTKSVDTETAWKRVQSKIKTTETKVIPIYPNTKNKTTGMLWYAAASVLFILSLSYLLIFKSNSKLDLSSKDKVSEHHLKDGTNVVLEANSNLKQLFEDKREYKLEGCASFNVVHDDKNPFIIHTGDVLIKDIGTVFKVKYLPKNDTILVRVTEGLVQFYNSTSSGLTLKAGENGYYLKSNKQFFKTNSAAESSENRQNIVFNNVTLEEVCAIIKKQFGKECYIENEAIKNCKINTTFTNATLQEVLDITTSTLGIWTVEKDNELYFNGKACN